MTSQVTARHHQLLLDVTNQISQGIVSHTQLTVTEPASQLSQSKRKTTNDFTLYKCKIIIQGPCTTCTTSLRLGSSLTLIGPHPLKRKCIKLIELAIFELLSTELKDVEVYTRCAHTLDSVITCITCCMCMHDMMHNRYIYVHATHVHACNTCHDTCMHVHVHISSIVDSQST